MPEVLNLSQEEFIELPASSRELIELLNDFYPHRCVALGEPETAAHRYAGIRELVDELVTWQAEQDEYDTNQNRH